MTTLIPRTDEAMATRYEDPLWRAAGHVADGLAEEGYAFLEDDQLETVVIALRSCLSAIGISVYADDDEDT